MKIIFLDLKEKTKNLIFPSLGLGYICSYLKKHLPEIELEILEHVNSKDDLIMKLKDSDLVGITFTTEGYSKAISISKFIKSRLNKPIIIGGLHASFIDKLEDCFNICVVGEGEATFLELVKNYKGHGKFSNIGKIKGIIYRKGKKIIKTEEREFIKDLDEIPPPDYSLYNLKYYLKKRSIYPGGRGKGASILTSRGCPYNCVFCCSARFWKNNIRYNSAEYTVSMMESLTKEHKVDILQIWDDLFVLNKKRLKKIVELMEQKGLNKKLRISVAGGRTNLIDDEVCQLLKRMNVRYISCGFESGSNKILNYLKKGTLTVDDNEKAIKLAKKYGFKVGGGVIFGTPGETEEDLEQTY